MLRFFLFGGVRVLDGDQTEIHLGKKQQQLLAILMVTSNRTIAADVLIDYLWGEALPANPLNSLQDLVKRLRIVLGDHSHRTIVTKNRDYGLMVDPDLLDLTLFHRLATAGLALAKPEPEVSRLLLAQALEYAVGDLPDFPPGSRASEEVDSLYRLRKSAADALEMVSSGRPLDHPLVEDEFPTSSLEGQPVGLALKIAELAELDLADLVGTVTRHQGRVHRLSQGLLLASFSGGATALRSAVEISEQFGSQKSVLIGGALSHVPPGGGIRATERLLQLARRAVERQILVTRDVRDSAATARLKEQLQPLEDDLWQIGHAPVEGPDSLASHSEVPMVGRDETIREVGELLRNHRFVTLRGPGGIGKTRIAREMAKILHSRFADGVSIVDFAEADRHGDPVSLVVRTLGLVPQPYRRPLDTLVDRLEDSERLIILDNSEELIEDVRSLSEALMDHCPGISLLATSRSALGADHEIVHDIGELEVADAAQLMVSLAFPEEKTRPDAFDSRVLGLCSLLDGVPLAIECAASIVRAIGLEGATAALASLPDGAVLPLLDAAHGGRGRHRSIELALNASYHRLQAEDARFFERLSSLRGGFNSEDSLAAVPEGVVYGAEAGLAWLSEASLLKRLGLDRWRMLEPVRQFAATRLLRRGEQVTQAARHARHFARLANRAENNLRGPDEGLWFARLTDAYPNLVKALSWAVESGDSGIALELTSSLWWYWTARGLFVEGSEACERALAVEGSAPRGLRAKTLVAAAHLAWWAGNPHRTESSLTEAMQLITPRELDSPELISLEAWARTGLAAARMWGGGDYEVLEAHLGEGRRLFSSLGDRASEGLNLATHSGIAWHYGNDALHYLKALESLRAFESAGHLTMVAQMKRGVGLAKAALGHVAAGRELIIEGLRLSEELDDIGGLPLGLCYLGLLEVWGGDRPDAVDAFRRSIIVNRSLGQVWPSLLAIGFASEEACLRGRPADGIRLSSVVDGLTNRTGIRLPPQERPRVQSAVELAVRTVGAEEAAKARDEGSEMELPQATLLALDVFDESGAGI